MLPENLTSARILTIRLRACTDLTILASKKPFLETRCPWKFQPSDFYNCLLDVFIDARLLTWVGGLYPLV